jgi:signal transduction histidine kinase
MTIKRRVRVALFLMTLIPVFFMAGAFGFASRYMFSTNLLGRAQSFLGEFNRLVNDDPHALSDPQSLAALDRVFGQGTFGWWEILRGDREVYRSSGAMTGADPRPDWRWHSGPMSRRGPPDLTWNFRFEDGSPGTLRVHLGVPWAHPSRSPLAFIGFLALLFGCNALLGWWVSSSVIAPLARLRNAAVRIGEGDLRFRLAPGGPDEFGQVTGAFETMREKLEAAVNRQLAEETSRKELIAHVSHDLRTPMNLIRGYAEGLRDGVASTPQMRERYLDTILERAEELERLIELLFSYSTMDLEAVRPKLAAVEVAPYLRGLRDSFAAAFPAAAITLILPGDEGSPSPSSRKLSIKADVELTRRVMSNLVENAVTHGGKPEIAIEWRVSAAGGGVDVAVRDDGAGVSAEDLPRIFEPFFRADRARARQRGGSGAGLGLSIVSRIMQAQGGSVCAAASPAGGLEVTLSFAKAENDVEANPDR